ncbi:hypothetical protein ACOMHN_004761 [Nucella lapillus]
MYPAMNALCARWVPVQERTKLVSFAYSGSELGIVCGMLLTGVLSKYGFAGGWPSAFYVFGVFGCVVFLLWTFLVYDSPADHPRISDRERRYIQSSVGQRVAVATPWRSILTSGAVWGVVVAHSAFSWGYFSMFTSLPIYMKQILGFHIVTNGSLSALPYLLMWVVQVLAGFVSDHLRRHFSTSFTRKLMYTIGSVIPACFVVGAGYVDCDHTLAVVLLTIGVTAKGMAAAVVMVNHLDFAPKFAGVLFGLSNAFATLPGSVAPSLIGFLTYQNWVKYLVHRLTCDPQWVRYLVHRLTCDPQWFRYLVHRLTCDPQWVRYLVHHLTYDPQWFRYLVHCLTCGPQWVRYLVHRLTCDPQWFRYLVHRLTCDPQWFRYLVHRLTCDPQWFRYLVHRLTCDPQWFSLVTPEMSSHPPSWQNQSSVGSLKENLTSLPEFIGGCRVVDMELEFLPWDNPDSIMSLSTQVTIYKVGGVVLPILCVLGIPLNVVNCIVYFKLGLEERVNLLLFCLGCADFVVTAYWFTNFIEYFYTLVIGQFRMDSTVLHWTVNSVKPACLAHLEVKTIQFVLHTSPACHKADGPSEARLPSSS